MLLIDIEPQGTSEYVEHWVDEQKPAGYLAARRAILSALLKNQVVGAIRHKWEEDVRGSAGQTEEVDHSASWVEVESLRGWLDERGFRDGFFSKQEGDAKPGYLDASHPRYASKLAAAVEAWEQYAGDDGKPGTAKQKLVIWLRLNAARFGLVDDDGKLSESVIDEIAKIANWARTGGAPRQNKQPDPGSDDEIPF